MVIQITANEWAILEHRLTVPDCIAEVLTADLPEEEVQNVEDSVIDAAMRLESHIREHRTLDTDALGEIEIEVLSECLNGSTFFGCLDSARDCREITDQKYHALRRAGDSLESKFRAAGIHCALCRY